MIDHRFYFKKEESVSVSDLLQIENCVLQNGLKKDDKFTDIAALDKALEGHLTFLHNEKYISLLKSTKAKACIISKDIANKVDSEKYEVKLLVSKNPYKLYCQIIEYLYGVKEDSHEFPAKKIADSVKIMPGSYIGEGVEIGENTIVNPHAVIMPGCKIGNNCVINAGAYVAFSILGDGVILQSGARVGTDGFGYFSDHNGHHKITHYGRVILEDNVEIGANSAIDRGSVGDTVIGEGTKVDNLVQVAHNVKIGKHCFLVSQAGVAGSTQIGNFVVLGGQVGVSGHLKIGDNTRFAAQAGITKNIPAHSGDYYGMPAQPKKNWQYEQIALRRVAKKSKN